MRSFPSIASPLYFPRQRPWKNLELTDLARLRCLGSPGEPPVSFPRCWDYKYTVLAFYVGDQNLDPQDGAAMLYFTLDPLPSPLFWKQCLPSSPDWPWT